MIFPRLPRPRIFAGCSAAAKAGYAILEKGGTALEAVEAAVRVMEDDPTFDAGFGSFLNCDGEVELDSIIMNGATLDFGSVAAVQRIKNPVSLARLVMEKSGHCMLAGDGAFRFADKMGIKPCRTQDLLTRTRARTLGKGAFRGKGHVR